MNGNRFPDLGRLRKKKIRTDERLLRRMDWNVTSKGPSVTKDNTTIV